MTKVHHWLGLVVALWLVVVTASGMLLLVKDEYYAWRYDALPDGGGLIAPDARVIAAILSDGDGQVDLLSMPTASLPAYHAWFRTGGEALYHPVTGALVGEWRVFDSLPAFLFELHAHLLFGDAGNVTVGLVGLLGAINLVIGVLLWWRRRKDYRLAGLLPAGLQKKQLLRAHVAQGTVLGPFLVVLLLSGVAVIFAETASAGLNAAFGVSGPLRPVAGSVIPTGERTDWQHALDVARDRFPDAHLRYIMPPTSPGQPLTFRLRNRGELHPNGRTYVLLHPESGEVLDSVDATETGRGPAIYNALYPIHSGKTGWPGYRFFLAILGLSLLYLSVSGAWLFVARPATR